MNRIERIHRMEELERSEKSEQSEQSDRMNNTQDFVGAVLRQCGDAHHGVGQLVIVTHLVPGADIFLRAVHRLIPIAAVIPKPHSIHAAVRRRLEQHIPVWPLTRTDINENPAGVILELRRRLSDNPFAIIDTGAYFCQILPALHRHFGKQLIGLVEDTENGHQKYESLLARTENRTFPCSLASVARSDLKKPEDFLVGQAIVFSAEALLREQGAILTGKRAAVFGYGKVGRSIAQNLHCKSASVEVIDTDASRQVLALAHGYHTGPVDEVLARADLLFCATGNLSLKPRHVSLIKKGAYVFTATSADDEIEGHRDLLASGCRSGGRRWMKIRNPQGEFHLCNNGNSVNFVHGGIVGDFVRLVQAEFILAATQLSRITQRSRIHILDDPARRAIAALWLQHFSP